MALAILLTVALWSALGLCAQTPAQDLGGTWQGTLKTASREFRIVLRVTTDANRPKAVFYSLDQGTTYPATAIIRDGSTVTVTIGSVGASYQGKLGLDGQTMTGTWTQGTPLPLNLARATPRTAWAIPEPPPVPTPMAAGSNPVFEVATIKPNRTQGSVLLNVEPSGVFTTTNTSLAVLIKLAYDLHADQIAGLPGWAEKETFDVTAKPDQPGKPSIVQLKAMVGKLLADRFQLSFHRSRRVLAVYAITLAKSGPKLAQNENDPNGLFGGLGIGPGRLGFTNITMAELATMLQSSILDRPVVDQTGLGAARYDLFLRWTPDGGLARRNEGERPAENTSNNMEGPPDLFAAFQQQLGLRLESTKAMVDVFVIDRAEPPSEN